MNTKLKRLDYNGYKLFKEFVSGLEIKDIHYDLNSYLADDKRNYLYNSDTHIAVLKHSKIMGNSNIYSYIPFISKKIGKFDYKFTNEMYNRGIGFRVVDCNEIDCSGGSLYHSGDYLYYYDLSDFQMKGSK